MAPNDILSALVNDMTFINAIMTAIFDALLRPFAGLSPWYGIAVVSLLTGVMMLAVFRYTSNQRAIRRAKDRIRAHLLELRLYRDDVGVLLRAQKDILLNNLIYLAHSLVPLAVMILPVVLILMQLNVRYGYQPLRPGESVIVAAKLKPGVELAQPLQLVAPSGLTVETPPLRIPALGELDWRVRGERPGAYELHIIVGDRDAEKSLVVSDGWARVSRQVSRGFLERLSNPGELPAMHEGFESVAVDYRPAALPFWRWNVHWLLAYFVLSIAFGFALRGVLKVEI